MAALFVSLRVRLDNIGLLCDEKDKENIILLKIPCITIEMSV